MDASEDFLGDRLQGEFKFLDKTINRIGPEHAIRAFIELAAYLRLLDDSLNRQLSGVFARQKFGRIAKKDGSEEPLFLRDLTNKIVHAKEWKWDTSAPNEPKLICLSNDPDRWLAAEVDINAFAVFCGGLGH